MSPREKLVVLLVGVGLPALVVGLGIVFVYLVRAAFD